MNKHRHYKNEEEFSIKSLLFLLYTYRFLLLKISSLMIFCIFISVFSKKPIFRSSALIMIENSSQAMGIFDMDLGNDKNYIENEIKVLKSRTIGNKAISDLLYAIVFILSPKLSTKHMYSI